MNLADANALRLRCRILLQMAAIISALAVAGLAGAARSSASGQITGVVRDALGRPVPGVELELRTPDAQAVARTISSASGLFSFTGLTAEAYVVTAHKQAFKLATAAVKLVAGSAQVALSIEAAAALTVQVNVHRFNRALNDLSPETGGSVYHFSEKTIHDMPQGENTSLRNVLTQAPGVTQDSFDNGQFHVRGADGQIQYRINGIMLPEIDSSFGPIFNPRFARSIDLLDGTLPSQFGYRTAGVIDIRTKSGCTNPGGDIQMYGGQRETYQPSFEFGGCKGKLDYYATGQYLATNRGVQPPTPGPTPIHDFAQQGQGFGYLSYALSPLSRLTLMSGLSLNSLQIPNTPGLPPHYSLAGVPLYPSTLMNENQLEQTYFNILALQGSLEPKINYQVAVFNRYLVNNFYPDHSGDLIYNGVASRVMNSSSATGMQGDLSYAMAKTHTLRSGFYFNEEGIEFDNRSAVFSADASGEQTSDVPFNIIDNFNKLTFLGGVYAQDEWRPTDRLTLNYGMRWDIMDAFTEENAFEPRLGAVYHLTSSTALHAGYARYFTPPPLELVTLRTIRKFNGTTNAVPNVGNQNVRPERDHYFDAGVIRQLTSHYKIGVDSYFKLADQMLDDIQFGNALMFAPQNYRSGRSWGVELSNSYNSDPLTAWFNFTYLVVQATGISSMQFAFDPEELAYINGHYINIDQSQLFTMTAGAEYRLHGWVFSFDALWNRGLYAGFANLNTLPSYAQVNAGITRAIEVPGVGRTLARLSVVNMFDRVYMLRDGSGVGVNAANYGPRRAIYLGLTVPLTFLNAITRHASP